MWTPPVPHSLHLSLSRPAAGRMAEQDRILSTKLEDQRMLSLKLTEAQLRGEIGHADAGQMRQQTHKTQPRNHSDFQFPKLGRWDPFGGEPPPWRKPYVLGKLVRRCLTWLTCTMHVPAKVSRTQIATAEFLSLSSLKKSDFKNPVWANPF
jgi:hypothetical protein